MSGRVERARVLLATNRPELAAEEARGAIAEDPSSPYAHALLATCLLVQGSKEGALAAAQEAVALGPDLAFAHHVHARALDALDRLGDAEAAVRQAILLAPGDPDPHALLAALHLRRSRTKDALFAADTALALDPEHAAATSLRAFALVRLGRRDEAAATVEGALARDPDDATAHASLGWTLLHGGKAREARRHFEEALRIDPENDWAREGLVESIKAGSLVYRWILRGFLRLGRLGPRAQIAFVVGFYVLQRVALGLRSTHPSWSPWLTPILWAYVALVVISWLGAPLANLALRLHPVGRRALSASQRRTSNAVGLLLLAAAVAGGVHLLSGDVASLAALVVFATLTLPANAVFSDERASHPLLLRGTAIALAVIGVGSVLALAIGMPAGGTGIGVYVGGIVVFTWLSTLSVFAARPR